MLRKCSLVSPVLTLVRAYPRYHSSCPFPPPPSTVVHPTEYRMSPQTHNETWKTGGSIRYGASTVRLSPLCNMPPPYSYSTRQDRTLLQPKNPLQSYFVCIGEFLVCSYVSTTTTSTKQPDLTDLPSPPLPAATLHSIVRGITRKDTEFPFVALNVQYSRAHCTVQYIPM